MTDKVKADTKLIKFKLPTKNGEFEEFEVPMEQICQLGTLKNMLQDMEDTVKFRRNPLNWKIIKLRLIYLDIY